MPIPTEYDSLLFARRCVAAHFLGREESLRTELSYAGLDVSVDEIVSHGQAWTAVFRMDDLDKSSCFLCGSHRLAGTLCSCFHAVMPFRHYNVHDALVMQKLPPETVVETYVCTECGDLADVYAGHAANAHRRFKAYKPRKRCEPCFRVHAADKPRKGPRRGGKGAPKLLRPDGTFPDSDRPSKAFKAQLEAKLAPPTTQPNTAAPT